MYICNCCGKLIDELSTDSQCHGYSGLGEAFVEEYAITECSCGGDFVEARQCEICGEYYSDEDYPYNVCECCMEEYESTETALEIGERDTKKIDINGYVAFMFTEEEINAILKEHILKHCADDQDNVVDFCEGDKSWFADFIIEKSEEEKDKL